MGLWRTFFGTLSAGGAMTTPNIGLCLLLLVVAGMIALPAILNSLGNLAEARARAKLLNKASESSDATLLAAIEKTNSLREGPHAKNPVKARGGRPMPNNEFS